MTLGMTGHHLMPDENTHVTCMHERNVRHMPPCSSALSPTFKPVQPPWLRRQCHCKTHRKYSDGAESGHKVCLKQNCSFRMTEHMMLMS